MWLVCKQEWKAHTQVVGEKLSLHVLANYEEFVRGVNEVASIEQDLQVGICPRHALQGLPVAVVGMLHEFAMSRQLLW